MCGRPLRRSLEGIREKTAQLVDPELEFHGTVGGLQEGQIAHGQSEIDEKFEAEDLEAWEERRFERRASSSTPATRSLCSCTSTGAAGAAESSWKLKHAAGCSR